MANTGPSSPNLLTDVQFQTISRALADPRRFAMLQQISAAESMPCCDLREQQLIGAATISHHLKELAEAGLITVERQGRIARLTLCRPVLQAYVARLGALLTFHESSATSAPSIR